MNLYGYVGNNPINGVDPFGLERKLTAEEQKKLDDLLKRIRKCGDKDPEIKKALDALNLKGIYDATDVKKDPDTKNDSDTTFGPFWLTSSTRLAADFFQDNDIWNEKTRTEVLIHEGWHAWQKSSNEDKAYPFGSKKCDLIWGCVKGK